MADRELHIKNIEYVNAIEKYANCVTINFENLKRDHVKFDKFINNADSKNLCKKYLDEIKNIVNEGGLEYDNFI